MTLAYDPTSFTTAKRLVFERLVASIGTLTSLPGWTAKNGKNSYNGFLPPAFDIWAITFGGGGDVRQTWNTVPWALHMNADIEGQFREQPTADEVGMRLVEGLGAGMRWINDAGVQVAQTSPHRIQAFRMRSGGNLDVFLGHKQIANEAEAALVWIMKIGCEIVFNTGTDAA